MISIRRARPDDVASGRLVAGYPCKSSCRDYSAFCM